MWKVTALVATGDRRSVTVVEGKPGKPFHSADFAGDRGFAITSNIPHLRELLEAQASDPLLTFAAIETWAEQAETMARDYDWAGAPPMRRIDHGLARYAEAGPASASPGERPRCIAWHERTGVLVPLGGEDEELTLEYEPDRDDEILSSRLLHRCGGEDATVETYFDWRAFVGRKTAVIDGRSLLRRRGRGFVASLKGATGFLVGTVLKVVTRPEPTLHIDPRWRSRLAELELRYRYLADACPNLCEVERAAHDQAMVFVHGTMSCGMVSLKDLFGLAVEGFPVPGHVYRYEHDTFLPVKDNAEELADWIERKLRISRRLVIAAHSRGGLVAVSAAARLMKNRYPAEIVVRTFGTPFLGTPLVAIGKKTLTLLAKLGEEISTVVPVPMLSALAKGFFYLFDSPTLPPGIMAMQEGPGVLDYLQDAASDVSLESWGSSYDADSGNPGFGASMEGVLLGALRGTRHDLVVPMSSAIHCGKSIVPVQSCSHVHYFRQPPVRQAIDALLQPPPTVAATPAAGLPAGDTSSSAAPSATRNANVEAPEAPDVTPDATAAAPAPPGPSALPRPGDKYKLPGRRIGPMTPDS